MNKVIKTEIAKIKADQRTVPMIRMFNLDKFISDSVTFCPISIFELLYNAYC